jgi:hypothetical protein
MKAEHFVHLEVYRLKHAVPPLQSSWYMKYGDTISALNRMIEEVIPPQYKYQRSKWLIHLSANWTNPHLLPDGILTWTSSPYCTKTCLKWSSVTLGSKLPTKICNEEKSGYKQAQRRKIYTIQRNTHGCIIWIVLVLCPPLRILIWSCIFIAK